MQSGFRAYAKRRGVRVAVSLSRCCPPFVDTKLRVIFRLGIIYHVKYMYFYKSQTCGFELL